MIIGIIFIIGVIYAVIGLVSGMDQSDLDIFIDNSVLMNYVSILLFIVSAFAMHAFYERKKGWAFGLKQRNGGLFAVHGALAGIILISLSGVLIWVFGGVSWKASEWNQELTLSLLEGILFYTAVAVSEEIYSRGYLQGLLRYHYGATAAIIVSSVLFALLHSMNPGAFESPLPMMNLLLAGIIMALARELTGGLWWPIGLHLTWNYFQGYVYGFNVSGKDSIPSILRTIDNGPAWLSGGAFGIEGSFISVVMLVLGTIGVYAFYMKNNASRTPSD